MYVCMYVCMYVRSYVCRLFEMPGEDEETEAMVKITSLMISPEAWAQVKPVVQPSLDGEDGTAEADAYSRHVIARVYTREMFWCDLRTKKVCGWP
jgi:hypothetical protein